jgi:hypothetical protein
VRTMRLKLSFPQSVASIASFKTNQEERIAVGQRTHRHLGRNIAASAGSIFNDEGLPERIDIATKNSD